MIRQTPSRRLRVAGRGRRRGRDAGHRRPGRHLDGAERELRQACRSAAGTAATAGTEAPVPGRLRTTGPLRTGRAATRRGRTTAPPDDGTRTTARRTRRTRRTRKTARTRQGRRRPMAEPSQRLRSRTMIVTGDAHGRPRPVCRRGRSGGRGAWPWRSRMLALAAAALGRRRLGAAPPPPDRQQRRGRLPPPGGIAPGGAPVPAGRRAGGGLPARGSSTPTGDHYVTKYTPVFPAFIALSHRVFGSDRAALALAAGRGGRRLLPPGPGGARAAGGRRSWPPPSWRARPCSRSRARPT